MADELEERLKQAILATPSKSFDNELEERLAKNLTPGSVQQAAGEVPSKEYYKSIGRGAIKGATLQNLSPEEEQTPGMQLGEMAGSAIPMALSGMVVPGSPAITPFAKAGLTGIVYGGAKSAANRQSFMDSLSNIGKSGLSFMAAERLGQLAGKMFTPFSGGVTPELEAGRKAAEAAGIKAPLGSLTENKAVQFGERALEYSPFGSSITKMRLKALDKFKQFVEKIGDNLLGSNTDPDVKGALIKENVVAYKDAFDQTKEQLFESVMPVLKNKPVDVSNTVKALEDVIARRSGPAEPAGLNQVREWLARIRKPSYESRYGYAKGGRYIPATEEVVGQTEVGTSSGRYIPAERKVVKEGVPSMLVPEEIESQPGQFVGGGSGLPPKAPTHIAGMLPSSPEIRTTPGKFIGGAESGPIKAPRGIPGMLTPEPEGAISVYGELKKFRTNVGQKGKFNDPATSGLSSDIDEIYAAASKDLDNAASAVGDDVAKAINEANEYNALGMRTLKSKIYKALANAPQDRLYRIAFVPGSTINYTMVRDIVGKDSMRDLAGQWYHNILEKNTKEGILSPKSFLDDLEKNAGTVEKLGQDFPEIGQGFAKIQQVATLLSKGRQIVQGSQTAPSLLGIGAVLGNLATTLGLLFSPKAALASAGVLASQLGASAAGVRGITSNAGREFLTRGYPGAGAAAKRATQLATQLGLQKATEK